MVGQNGKDGKHSAHIVGVVEKKEFFGVVRRRRRVVVIDANQFSAVKGVDSVDSQKLFQCLLFTVGQTQELFVRCGAPVKVDALKGRKVLCYIVLGTFLEDKRKVKVIAVKNGLNA